MDSKQQLPVRLTRHTEMNHHKGKKTSRATNRVTCDICEKKFNNENVLNRHNEQHHVETVPIEEEENKNKKEISKRKTCSLCGKKFNKETTFRTHIETMHGEKIENNKLSQVYGGELSRASVKAKKKNRASVSTS